MEETILLQSKPASLGGTLVRRFLVPVLLLLVMVAYYFTTGREVIQSHLGGNYNGSLTRFLTSALIFDFDAAGTWLMPVLLYLAILSLIVGIVLFLKYNGCRMTVTDQRIYGVAAGGKRVDFQLGTIQSISASGKHSVTLLTPSGSAVFGNLANSDELFQTVSRLLAERQKA